MKNPIVALLLAAGTAFAGSPAKEVIPPPPAPEPSLWQWFAGASAGYLIDAEELMFHGHIGVDTPYDWGGWRSAIFLEVGYAETDTSAAIVDPSITAAVVTTPLVSEFSFVPVTLNFKLEREIAPNLNFYIGAGAGVAFTEFEGYANYAFFTDPYISDSDEVFCAQIFTGLNYDVTESFELYGGARWIYLDDSSFSGAPFSGLADIDSDFLVEGGLRFNF
ncbi:outer membrane protein [Luteolibacter marinus]|uniref:outer membrane protein n=1 Tax=Luteolibacter marinus TaxID=2776705 RepID=UPI0018688B26|nr:hypothetical protein [Luteolibacter marinus]